MTTNIYLMILIMMYASVNAPDWILLWPRDTTFALWLMVFVLTIFLDVVIRILKLREKSNDQGETLTFKNQNGICNTKGRKKL